VTIRTFVGQGGSGDGTAYIRVVYFMAVPNSTLGGSTEHE